MRKLIRALVGLGLAGALFLGAGAAVAQTAGDESSSTTATTTAPEGERNGTPADCPDRGNGQDDSDQSNA